MIVDTGLHYKGMKRSEAFKMFAEYAWDDSDFTQKEVYISLLSQNCDNDDDDDDDMMIMKMKVVGDGVGGGGVRSWW